MNLRYGKSVRIQTQHEKMDQLVQLQVYVPLVYQLYHYKYTHSIEYLLDAMVSLCAQCT